MLTRPHARRVLRLLTITVLTVAVSAGCARLPDEPITAPDGPTTAGPTTTGSTTTGPTTAGPAQVSVAELSAALTAAAAAAKATPDSAKLETRSVSNGQLAATSTGRVNLTDPLTGQLEVRTTDVDGAEPLAVVEVLTTDAIYLRSIEDSTTATPGPSPTPDPSAAWQQQDRAGSRIGRIPDLFGYAELLLQGGEAAVTAEEPQNGAPATRLSGRITTAQIRTVEPDLYQRLTTDAVDGFDCDVWVDRQGRVVRLEQAVSYRSKQIVSSVALSEFAAPIAVERPRS